MSFERLQSADPAASPDEVTMARLRRRVLRAGRRFPAMSVAASLTAFALIAGAGVAVGRFTAPTAGITATGSDQLMVTPQGSARMGEAMGGDDAAKSYMPWGGRVILNPAGSLSDQGGTAPGFTLSPNGVDKDAVLRDVADLIGAKGAISRGDMGSGDTSINIGKNDGTEPVATIYDEPMLNFYGYNNERSPWNCVRQEDIDQYGSKDGYPGPDVRICTDEDLKPASKSEAERAFATLLAVLDLDAGDVTKSFVDTGSPQVIMIQGNAKISGTETNMQQLAVSVSARGLFNVSGFASRFVQVNGYEIVGAKTAALRSQLSKWSSLGPNPFGDWGAYPMARDGIAATPQPFAVEGRPGVLAFIDTIDVSKARLGLVSYWNESGTMVLPSWIFTAADGRQWSMIALAEKYVKFGSTF